MRGTRPPIYRVGPISPTETRAALTVVWMTRALPVHHPAQGDAADDQLTYGAQVSAPNGAYDLVDALRARLSAPYPASTGWPDGWQGVKAFEEDIRRIARIASGLYSSRRHPPSDIVEQVLTEVARRLGHEPAPIAVPLDEESWRPEHGRPARATRSRLSPSC